MDWRHLSGPRGGMGMHEGVFRPGRFPIQYDPLRSITSKLLLMLHTYILLGCHLGCLRRPRNLCVLDAARIFEIQAASRTQNLGQGQKENFALHLPRRGCRKSDSILPFGGGMLRLRGYMPPAANGKLASITPFCRGQCCTYAGKCPRRPTENWAASPPFAGGNAAPTRVRAPGGQQKFGQHHPLLQGAMLPDSTNVVLQYCVCI